MSKAKRLLKRGFTLIELMIVVVIIGILASLAIYGVQKYVASSKSAEARMMLGRISKDALIAYEGENQEYKVLSLGKSAGAGHLMCPSGAMVPTAVPANEKYQPQPSDWQGDSSTDGGWDCLGFEISTPIYFAYEFDSTGTIVSGVIQDATSASAFTAKAFGDLDGDATTSEFRMAGAVKADTSTGQEVMVLATTVEELNPEE